MRGLTCACSVDAAKAREAVLHAALPHCLLDRSIIRPADQFLPPCHVLVGIQHSPSWTRSVPGLCATTLGHTRVSTVPVVVCNLERLCSTWHAVIDAPRPAAGGAAHPATEAALAPSAC